MDGEKEKEEKWGACVPGLALSIRPPHITSEILCCILCMVGLDTCMLKAVPVYPVLV